MQRDFGVWLGEEGAHRKQDEWGSGCVWMDERWEIRVGRCSDAQQFGERLIFLVLRVAPVQAGLLERLI